MDFDPSAGDPHRESARRQHRFIGHYLAIQAWVRQLDCLVLSRFDLEKFLGLQRFKSTRLDWFWHDIEPWFPHQETYWFGSGNSIASVFLSRVPIEQFLPQGTMSDKERISRMAPASPRTALFSKSEDESDAPSQEEIVSDLALLAAGLVDPHQQRRKKRKR